MKTLMILFIISFFLLLLMAMCLFISSGLKGFTLEKSVGFECGFLSFSMYGFSFSMPFFIISLMFLLFDVEILLLSVYPLSSLLFVLNNLTFIVILLVLFSTLYEWSKGILSWL